MDSHCCLGCQLPHKELFVYVVYEDEYVTCIVDHDPFNSGHALILLKKHFLDVDHLDSKTAYAIMDASSLISRAIKMVYQPDGITICQNGGIFNELTHYHMHVIPRYENQSFADFYLESKESSVEKIVNFEIEMLKIKNAIDKLKRLDK